MSSPSLRREIRYGMPAADQIIFNRDEIHFAFISSDGKSKN